VHVPQFGNPSLGLGVSFGMLLASVVQPSPHLSCVSVMLQAADE